MFPRLRVLSRTIAENFKLLSEFPRMRLGACSITLLHLNLHARKRTPISIGVRFLMVISCVLLATKLTFAETIPLPADPWRADFSNTRHTRAVDGCVPAAAARNSIPGMDPIEFDWATAENPPTNVSCYGTRTISGASNVLYAYIRWEVYCPSGYTLQGTYPNQSCIRPDPPTQKDAGPPTNGACYGNPCNPANGNKLQTETDFRGGNNLLIVARTYNSLLSPSLNVGWGAGWSVSGLPRLEISSNTVVPRNGLGRGETFNCAVSPCTGDADTRLSLTKDTSGYVLTSRDGASERYDTYGRLLTQTTSLGQTTTYTYDISGRLAAIKGPFGHILTYIWDTTNNRVTSIALPDNQTITYTYNGANLTRVTYPDNTARIYHYENTAFPNHLTGISLDSGAGNVRRLSTYAYKKVTDLFSASIDADRPKGSD